MILFFFINIIVWAFVLLYLYQSSKVIYECRAGNKIIIIALFFIIAITQYLNHPNTEGVITCGSLMIAGVIYSLVKSGFGTKGFYVLGRFFAYTKVNDVKLERKHNMIYISFDYKKRTKYLFAKVEDEYRIRELIQKYYYQG